MFVMSLVKGTIGETTSKPNFRTSFSRMTFTCTPIKQGEEKGDLGTEAILAFVGPEHEASNQLRQRFAQRHHVEVHDGDTRKIKRRIDDLARFRLQKQHDA